MPRSQPERRRFPRFPFETALLLRETAGGGPALPARTLEISAGGCKVVHEAAIGVGAEVELEIPTGIRSIRATGRVVYELPLRGGRFQIGVEFLRFNLRDHEALAALLSQRTAPSTA